MIDRTSSPGVPRSVRVALALAFPLVAAFTVAGTFLGKEIVIFALWVGLGVGAVLFVRPIIGIAAITAVLLFTAYPTLLQTYGFLTLNNLLGVCFVALLTLHILETRDLSFIRLPQVLIYLAIGLILLLATLHAEAIFPLLQESRIHGRLIDRTDSMTQDFVTRLAFLVFVWAFVRSKADIRVLFLTFMLALFLAVPSAILNYVQGALNRGFRAVASVTAGSNPNRLAMICLMEVACWWFWAQARQGLWRRALAALAIGASLFVLLATGSRSGLLGVVVLAILLQTGPRTFRVSTAQMGSMAIVGCIAVATLVPAAAWQRMTNLFPDPDTPGASSNMKREDTIEVGVRMFRDHPVLGVGLGNFREVARQNYRNKFFRPPHNSYLWAAAEGGVFVLLGYLALFVVTWRDLRTIMAHAHRDPEIAHMAAALRVVFPLYCFFGFFADLWLNPITYVMIGLIITMRRYIQGLRVPAPAVVRVPRRLPAFRTA